jgi:hypothetical protein
MEDEVLAAIVGTYEYKNYTDESYSLVMTM